MLLTQTQTFSLRHPAESVPTLPRFALRMTVDAGNRNQADGILRDMAFVLAMTNRVKSEMLEGSAVVV